MDELECTAGCVCVSVAVSKCRLLSSMCQCGIAEENGEQLHYLFILTFSLLNSRMGFAVAAFCVIDRSRCRSATAFKI